MEICLHQNIADGEMNSISQLRTQVWSGEPDVNLRSLGPEPWIDPIDRTACHWTLKIDNQLAAAARITLHTDPTTIPYHTAFLGRLTEPGPYGAMNRLVVHRKFRGRGFARLLDSLRLQHAPRLGAKQVVVVASGHRVAALEALGFENLGLPNPTPELLRIGQTYRILVHHLLEIPDLPPLD